MLKVLLKKQYTEHSPKQQFLEQLNKERIIAEDAFEKSQDEWNNRHYTLKENLENELHNSIEDKNKNKKIAKKTKIKKDEITKLHSTIEFLKKKNIDAHDLQRDLVDTNDQFQIALKEAAQIAEENDRHFKQIGDFENALESTNVALDAANAAYQGVDDLLKQVVHLSQQLSDEKEATQNQTGQLALQVEEIRSQAATASELVEELAQQLKDVKCQFEAANYFAEGIAADLANQLEAKLDQDAGFFRQLEGTIRNEAKDLIGEVEAVKKVLEGVWNSADDLSRQLKDAQTRAEIAGRLTNGANVEFTILLEGVWQLCNTKEQSQAASVLAEGVDKALYKQLEDATREAKNATGEIRGLKIQVEAANRLVGSAGQALARYVGKAKRQVEAASFHALNVAVDAREIIAGLKGQIEGLEFALSKMSQGEDFENLVAERDELLQKLAENAEKAASDADIVAQLRDSLAKVAVEKQILESELNIAQDAYNTKYTAGKAPSKRYSAAVLHQINPMLPLEDVSIVGTIDAAHARSNRAGSRQNSAVTGGASIRASLSGPPRKTSSVVSSRKNSTTRPSTAFDFSGAILDGSLPKFLPKSLTGAASVVEKPKRASSVVADVQQTSFLAQSTTDDLIQRASILAENNAEILVQRALILAENNADVLAKRASMLAKNTADVLAQRASVLVESTAEALADTALELAENTTDVLAQRALVLADSANTIPQRASMIAQNIVEALPPRPSLLAQRISMKRVTGTLSEDVMDFPRISVRRLSGAGASRRSSTALPSTAVLPFFVQDSEDPIKRSMLVRPSIALAGTSRKNSSKLTGARIGSGVLPDQLQEKLENLENEIMEAKRNSLLGGSFNESVGVEEFTEYDQPEIYFEPLPHRRASTAMPECGKRYSSVPPGIAVEVGGGSKSFTRTGSSRGSRLVDKAENVERIANLKAQVSMFECKRDKERVSALEASKAYDKSDEMMRRIQQLELALQQAHEDYKILSNDLPLMKIETKQLHYRKSSRDRGDRDREDRCTDKDKDNRKKCPQDVLRDLECEIDKKRSDLEFAEFSMQKVVEKYGRCIKGPLLRSTPLCITDGSTTRPPNIHGDATPSLEFTHLKMGHLTGTSSEMVTFTTSGPMGPQLVRIVEQVGKNLPQIIMREVGKIATTNLPIKDSSNYLPSGNDGSKCCLPSSSHKY